MVAIKGNSNCLSKYFGVVIIVVNKRNGKRVKRSITYSMGSSYFNMTKYKGKVFNQRDKVNKGLRTGSMC